MKILKDGPGIPIVFLHGFLGRAEDWLPVCSFLPPSCCIGYNLPGHGGMPFAAEFEIDLPRFHLVGYSMGGRIALQQFAKRAETLTLISVHPGLKTEEEKAARFVNDQKWANLLLELPIDEFLRLWYDQPIFASFKPDFNMRKQQNTRDLSAALLHFSLAKQKRYEIEGIVGERDAKFRALYENPILIADAGHMAHLENPRAVAEIIKARIGL